MRGFKGVGLPFLGAAFCPPFFPTLCPSLLKYPLPRQQFSAKDSARPHPSPPHHRFPFLSPSPLVFVVFFFFNMQVAMKNLLMKYLLRSLLWARLITYLCLSLASLILNTHLLSV